jgi:hypothetical protein
MRDSIKFPVIAAMVCILSSVTFAGAMLSPISATASLPTETTYPDCTISKTIDQSGLVMTFVSGVTEYTSYMAGDPKHEALDKDGCYLSENVYFGNGVTLTFDLGSSYSIEHMVIWNGAVNQDNSNAGIKDATLYFSEYSDFSGATSFGIVVPEATNPLVPFGAYVFDLGTPLSAQYIRIAATTNYGNTGHYSVSEVAFGVVPEPMTAILLGFGAIGVLKRSRR